jgi:hypothetical protein
VHQRHARCINWQTVYNGSCKEEIGHFAKGTPREEAIQLLHLEAPIINVPDWSPANICDLIETVEAESKYPLQAKADKETL